MGWNSTQRFFDLAPGANGHKRDEIRTKAFLPNPVQLVGAKVFTSGPINKMDVVTAYYTPEYRASMMNFTDAPPGVHVHDENAPNGRGVGYIVVSILLLLISTIIVALRFYAKIVLIRAPGWDDCMLSLTRVARGPKTNAER